MNEKVIHFPASVTVLDSLWPCLIHYTAIINRSGGAKSIKCYFSFILSWEEWVQTFDLQVQGKAFLYSVNAHT